MSKPLLFLIAGLAGGFVVAAWWTRDDVSGGAAFSPSALESPDLRALPERVDALEQQLEAERLARRRADSELASLREELAALTPEASAAESEDTPAEQRSSRDESDSPPPAAPVFGGRFARQRTPEGLVDALVGAGFSLDRATAIERRTQELRVEAMQARFDAAREGTTPDRTFNINQQLRAELGDADYERYLEATGRPIRVGVGSVLASSAAEQAGMLPGDEIVTYGGQRVFDAQDLNRLQLEGQAGEPVLVDVVRDGQQVQLVLPRGPLGITSGGFGGRGPRALR